jgi:hypothetical protein
MELVAQNKGSFTRLAVAIVISAVILAVAALTYSSVETTVTRTSTFMTIVPSAIIVTSTLNHTTTVYNALEQVGYCNTTSYFVPDTIQATLTVITVTSDNSTFTTTSYYDSGPQTSVQTGASYRTTVYGNETGTYTIVRTSTGNYVPSSGWTVTACTFG